METTIEKPKLPMTVQQGLACYRLLGNPEYKWSLVCRDGQRDKYGKHDGHSFWREQLTGLISICDQSGNRPDMTDDGVLWLDDAKPWVVGDRSRGDAGHYMDVPVVREDGSTCRCWMTWKDGLHVAKKLGIRVVVSKESSIAKLLPLLRDLPIEE
jgi:hypothetical protein